MKSLSVSAKTEAQGEMIEVSTAVLQEAEVTTVDRIVALRVAETTAEHLKEEVGATATMKEGRKEIQIEIATEAEMMIELRKEESQEDVMTAELPIEIAGAVITTTEDRKEITTGLVMIESLLNVLRSEKEISIRTKKDEEEIILKNNV